MGIPTHKEWKNEKPSHPNNLAQKRKEEIRIIAQEEGFDVVAFAAPTQPPQAHHLIPWLAARSHGEMAYMEKNVEKRMNPRQLVANVGCILVLGVNYRPPAHAGHDVTAPSSLVIAAHARHREYQTTLKKRLKKLARRLEEKLDRKINGRIFVDTAPVMEKPVAAGSGLGWQGKNSLLVHRQYGCWLLLSEFFLDMDLPPDPPMANHCGSCDRCQTACPTQALHTPWQLEASRCLAYLTIEYAGTIPPVFRKAMGNRVFGCNDCLSVCPWNRFAPETKQEAFYPRPALVAPKLLDFAFMNDDQFRTAFKQSAIKRTGRVRFLRNLAVALGNWGAEEAISALFHLFSDPHPLIRGHAAWGLGRLNHPQAIHQLRQGRERETDPVVRHEIEQALNLPNQFEATSWQLLESLKL